MAYIINKYDGSQLVVLEDATLDTTTSLNLVGRNYVGYGEIQNENFLFLLENFANNSPPPRPIEGQLWFNKAGKLVNVYIGDRWTPVGSAIVSELPPPGTDGQFWLNSNTNQVFVYKSNEWLLVGPEAAPNFGETRWKSRTILDTDNNLQPIVELVINGEVISISSNSVFTINPINSVPGFFNIKAGINIRQNRTFIGDIEGNSSTSSKFKNPTKINDVNFDGSENITIKASTTFPLRPGNFISGPIFDGSIDSNWNINATPNNIIGTIVSRDSAGDFSAGTINANLIGNVAGNVTAQTGISSFDQAVANQFIGNLTGNSSTTNRFIIPRLINGILFDGSTNITVPAAAGTLTGDTLSPGVTKSSLTSLGTLVGLSIADPGVSVGSANQFRVSIDGSDPTIRITDPDRLRIRLDDANVSSGQANFSFVTSQFSLSQGGDNRPAFIPDSTNNINLGHPQSRWNTVYANTFNGYIAANDIKGGSNNSLVYQNTANSTRFLPSGTSGQVLGIDSSGLRWISPSSANSSNTLVIRGAGGNFSAGTITATLNGNASTSTLASAATRLQTARRINGVFFDGTQDINILGQEPIWAGVSSVGAVVSTFSNNSVYPPGTKVAFWEQRFQTLFGGNGSATFSDLYRRVIRKENNFNGWADVGG
jgi:hypothetical protein